MGGLKQRSFFLFCLFVSLLFYLSLVLIPALLPRLIANLLGSSSFVVGIFVLQFYVSNCSCKSLANTVGMTEHFSLGNGQPTLPGDSSLGSLEWSGI